MFTCRLKNSMKVLINIKNSNDKFFLCCPVRHLNPLKIHPERIIKTDKDMFNNLDCEGIKFSVSGKYFGKIEKRNSICVNLFCYENNLVYPVYVSDQGFRNCMDLLLITEESRSSYVYIKDFNRFMCKNTKCEKNIFANIV